jgi:hypothetical protein
MRNAKMDNRCHPGGTSASRPKAVNSPARFVAHQPDLATDGRCSVGEFATPHGFV